MALSGILSHSCFISPKNYESFENFLEILCSVTVLTHSLEIILSRWTDRNIFIATAKSQKGACIAAVASRIKKNAITEKGIDTSLFSITVVDF